MLFLPGEEKHNQQQLIVFFIAAPKLQAHSHSTNLLSLVLNEFTQFFGQLF